MRRLVQAAVVLIGFGACCLGCGGKFKLPTENRENREIPRDGSYGMEATWSGPMMDGITDILLTQGTGSQLYIVTNHDLGGPDTLQPRGAVFSVGRFQRTGAPPAFPSVVFHQLFNPFAICVGTDESRRINTRLFVLDRGDTTIAYTNPLTGIYGDTTGGYRKPVKQLRYFWRVREYGLQGGDTLGTFTDTTVAYVNGVAADDQGRVYVSCLAIIQVPDPNIPQVTTRTFFWRIYRYIRGPATPGADPPDRNMPGANWHRDSWFVGEGNGLGTVIDARGLFWTSVDGGALFAADYRKDGVQKLSDSQPSTGYYKIPDFGTPPELGLSGPLDVTADLAGFSYITDTGNRRVLRYDSFGSFVQRVNIEKDAFGDTLVNPVTVAADDSLAFIGDARLGPGTGTARVIRYKRRQ